MRTALVALVIVLTASGCALATIRGPAADRPADQRPTCSTSHKVAKIDIGVGGFGFLVLVIAGGVNRDVTGNEELGTTLILAGVANLVAFYTSATVGYFRVVRCRRAIERWSAGRPPGAGLP